MSRFRLKRPSPALVVATAALFVALGGTGYAAFQVGTKNIKNGAVTTKKLHNGAVTNSKIANGAVNKSKLNLAGVTSPNASHANTANSATNATNATNASHANTANSATTAGSAGTAGTAGSSAALSGVRIVAGATQTLAAGFQGDETVTCPTGTFAIGGNELNSSTSPAASLNEVDIFGTTHDTVDVFMNNGSASSLTWNAYAVCVKGSETGSTSATRAARK